MKTREKNCELSLFFVSVEKVISRNELVSDMLSVKLRDANRKSIGAIFLIIDDE
jgi:hypothetical protein